MTVVFLIWQGSWGLQVLPIFCALLRSFAFFCALAFCLFFGLWRSFVHFCMPLRPTVFRTSWSSVPHFLVKQHKENNPQNKFFKTFNQSLSGKCWRSRLKFSGMQDWHQARLKISIEIVLSRFGPLSTRPQGVLSEGVFVAKCRDVSNWVRKRCALKTYCMTLYDKAMTLRTHATKLSQSVTEWKSNLWHFMTGAPFYDVDEHAIRVAVSRNAWWGERIWPPAKQPQISAGKRGTMSSLAKCHALCGLHSHHTMWLNIAQHHNTP